MKKNLLYFAALFSFFSTQAQTVQWAKKYPKQGESTNPEFLEISPAGGMAVAGEFATEGISQGVFLFKLDATGNVVWGDSLKGVNPADDSWITSRANPSGLDFSAAGKLFLGGNYNDTFNIDGTIHYPDTYENAFLIRYNASGGKDWVRTYPHATLNDVFVDAADNLFVMISFTGTLVFYGQTFTASGTRDLLLAKISPGDNLVFSKLFHGNVGGVKLKTVTSGNIFITGFFKDTMYYDTHGQAWSHNFDDFFILKMDPAGNQLYYQLICANQQEYVTDLEINYQERAVVSTTFCWTSGCYANLRTYDPAGNMTNLAGVDGTTCTYGCGFDMKSLTVADTAGFWGIGNEGNTLNYGIPDDDWTNLGLRKYDFHGNMLMYDTIIWDWVGYFPHKDIASDNAGNFYITAMLKDTLQLGSYTLVNSGTDPEYVIAKFSQAPIATEVGVAAVSGAFDVYPNPAAGIFNVNYKCNMHSCVCLTVKNILGEIIFMEERKDVCNGYTNKVDLTAQAKGIYFLEVLNGEERKVKKIVLN